MRNCLVLLLLAFFFSCKKNTSMSVELTGRWTGSEMMNPPGLHTGGFVPVPAGSGFYAEFALGAAFRGHYYFLDGWEQYQVWPEFKMATLYKKEKNDSMRIGFEIISSKELILTFPSYETSKLKLVR